PGSSIEMPGKDAEPPTAFTSVVPEREPPPGLVPIESVIGAVEDVMGSPFPSRTLTLTGGPDGSKVAVVMAVPICESAGCDVNSIPRWHEPVSVVTREL